MADTGSPGFDSQVLESIVKNGLGDSDRDARYYAVSTLAQLTKLQPVRSTELYFAREEEYISFWREWAKRGGIEAFVKASAGLPPESQEAKVRAARL